MISGDKTDRESIRRKLQGCIDSMNPERHPPEVVNIAIGKMHKTMLMWTKQ